MIRGLHQIDASPSVKVGMAFKSLSYAQTSSYYWSPSAYSGPGLLAQMERRWAVWSYRVSLGVFKITESASTEESVEGGISYRPRKGYFGEAAAVLGQGAGATPGAGVTNSEYRSASLKVGYEF
jgi:hypothetical protein